MNVDPRISLMFVVLAIIAVFAAVSWGQLLLLAGLAFFLLMQCDALGLFARRLVWLRWFFLFVTLLHMFLSPGYTLFGLVWLSYDGLLRGAQVCLQVSIALAASLVLLRLSSTQQLATALASFFRPLTIFGVNSDRFAGQVLMALYFVPILEDEVSAVSQEVPVSSSRIERLQYMITSLIERLVSRADVMAMEAASNDMHQPQLEKLPPVWPLALLEWIVVGLSVLITGLYFGLS